MKDFLKQSLTQMQNNKSINANEMCEYMDGQLSSKHSQVVERMLALSPQARHELHMARKIQSDIVNKEAVNTKQKWWWNRLPTMAFVILFTLLVGTLWNAQNQFNLLGLSQQQFDQLPKPLQLSIENISNGNTPEALFKTINSNQEIVRAQINNNINPQYPLWSRVENIQQLRWQATGNLQFDVMIINENDKLVKHFSNKQVQSKGNQYWLDLTSLKLCDHCQYAWRVMNTKTFEASHFIPFEIKPLTSIQEKELSELKNGIAKLSFYWQAGYLHQAYSQLQYIENNNKSIHIKSNIQFQLDLHMRKQ
jgi:hypothetical protein